MAHIVIITSGIASIYNSAFGLAQRLVRAGHAVTFASAAPIAPAVAAQGYRFVQLAGATPHQQEARTSRRAARAAGWLRRLGTIRERRRAAVAALGADDFRAKIGALAPDLCIVDVELSAAIIAACARNIPTAMLSAFASLCKSPGVPPLHLGIVPGEGWRGSRLGIELAWVSFRLWKWRQFFIQRVRAVGEDPVAVLREHANALGFPFDREVDRYQWLLPFIFRRLPLLYTNALEIDFPHDPPPSCRYLGPMLQLDRSDAHVSAAQQEVGAALDALLAERAQKPGRKLVYCAFGAAFTGDDTAFVRRVIDAVSAAPEWDVVVALGGRRDPRSLGELPPHVHAFGWAPQLRVLQHADCAVIHGGMSSVNECVSFGVPMLAYPFKQTNDQLGVAARVAYHRLGIVGDRDSDSAAKIRGHIEALLADDACRARVAAMREVFRRYDEQGRAVRVVEQLLSDARRGSYPLHRTEARRP